MLQNNLRPDAHDDFTLRTIYDGQGVFDCGEIYQYVIKKKKENKNFMGMKIFPQYFGCYTILIKRQYCGYVILYIDVH